MASPSRISMAGCCRVHALNDGQSGHPSQPPSESSIGNAPSTSGFNEHQPSSGTLVSTLGADRASARPGWSL